ncbi:MAG: 1-deoxy-D-xylulose-5-phosphate synthase, partial [Clostridia bacterium]|nr:1-deoxy-D-xylulose-5-phosphate synthase [Clostridia bacterium]
MIEMILEKINVPADVKKLNYKELSLLSGEMREKIVSAINGNGGHLSSNLGILETTVSLYKTFDFPKDKLIFDVGHQCYAHKILSGRKDRFDSIRTAGGLSGFPDYEESEYDSFTTGHAGNSVALGLGLCTARDRNGEDYFVITVVGDGALVNGLNLEAINASGVKPKKFIVILNDNGMSISRNRNGFYNFISKATIKKSYVKPKHAIKKIFGESFITAFFRGVRNFFKRILNKAEYFERFGFKYVGIVDGNDIKETSKVLERVKRVAEDKAVFLHLKTTKGKGVKDAEERADLYHSVGRNMQCAAVSDVNLGDVLNELIDKDGKIVAITAGMKDGTGLSALESAHPEHLFDVGIAEEYATTFAAGLAKGGLKPVVAVYSTFLQRAYDEIMQDVCLQNLPVVFCVDRAGFVGEDGKTH